VQLHLRTFLSATIHMCAIRHECVIVCMYEIFNFLCNIFYSFFTSKLVIAFYWKKIIYLYNCIHAHNFYIYIWFVYLIVSFSIVIELAVYFFNFLGFLVTHEKSQKINTREIDQILNEVGWPSFLTPSRSRVRRIQLCKPWKTWIAKPWVRTSITVHHGRIM
jgi:hypothetical protein